MSEPYQSRVFTFITNRTNRLKDSCVKGLRHIKVAVVWTGQILLYPIHLLAQTAKLFQPQLPPPPSQASLPHPVADINIEQALELVLEAGYPIEIAANSSLIADDWSFIDENLWHDKPEQIEIAEREITYSDRDTLQVKPPKPIIRGLSSLLIDRQIVLVTTENELLDILTTTQQQEIRRRIGLDIAITWHQWRTKISSDRKYATDRGLLPHDRIHDEWLAIDGEDLLDSLLLPPDTVNSDCQDLSLPTSVDRPQPNLRHRWQDLLQKFNFTPTTSPSPTAPESRSLPSAKYSFTPKPPQLDRVWELPQLPPIEEDRSPSQQNNIVLNTLAQLPPTWLKQWWSYYQEYLYIPTPTDRQIVHQPSDFKLIPLEPAQKIKFKQTSKQSTSIELKSGSIPQEIYQDLEKNQDWIDADSEDLGYTKSPVAKLLAWLDRIMFKIENWLIKIWNIVTNNPARDR